MRVDQALYRRPGSQFRERDFICDERWRNINTYRAPGSDPTDFDDDPKERFVYHNAGFAGYGGSSYIDDVILRDKDANTSWRNASDGVLEERIYYCQNWRHDVVALINSSGGQVEQVRYSAYGIPFGLPAGDADSSGGVTSGDVSQITTWSTSGPYDVRGDLNLDGVVDSTDVTLATAMQGTNLGWKKLSATGVANRKGYAGYESCFTRNTLWHVRHRVLESELGRWTRRDPLGYVDGVSLYEYGRTSPLMRIDPMGLMCVGLSCPPEYWQPQAPWPSWMPPFGPIPPGDLPLDFPGGGFQGGLPTPAPTWANCGWFSLTDVANCSVTYQWTDLTTFGCLGARIAVGGALQLLGDPCSQLKRYIAPEEGWGIDVPCAPGCLCVNKIQFFGTYNVAAQFTFQNSACRLVVAITATITIDGEAGVCCCPEE